MIHMRDMLEGKTPSSQVDMPTGIMTELRERFIPDDGIELSFRPGQLSGDDLLQIRVFVKDLMRRKSDAD